MNPSPFTNTPLVHHPPGGSSTNHLPPHPSFSYGQRPAPGPNVPGAVPYPGLSTFQPYTPASAAAKATATSTTTAASTTATVANSTTAAPISHSEDLMDGLISMNKEDGEEDEDGDGAGEGSDAWEAAQNILRAINFGRFLQDQGGDSSAAAPAIEQGGASVNTGEAGTGGAQENAASGSGAGAGVETTTSTSTSTSANAQVVSLPVFANDFTLGSIFSGSSGTGAGTFLESNAARAGQDPSTSTSTSTIADANASLTSALAAFASTSTSTSTAAARTHTNATVLSNEDRAALQAQLALLAAQLAEIAEDTGWDDDDEDDVQEDEGGNVGDEAGEEEDGMDVDDDGGMGAAAAAIVLPPPPTSAEAGLDIEGGGDSMAGVEKANDGSHPPITAVRTGETIGGVREGGEADHEPEEEVDELNDDDSDDGDMEMVDVPMHLAPYEQGLRT